MLLLRLKNLSTLRMSILQIPCRALRARLTKAEPFCAPGPAIVCGHFDKSPNNCQMLENDEIESDFEILPGPTKAREKVSIFSVSFCSL